MLYIHIFLATIFSSLLVIIFSLPSKNKALLPWNWPLMTLLPTAYLKSHDLYHKLTQVLSKNNGTLLFRTSWFTNIDVLVTSDPLNVQHVMNTKYSIYQRGLEFRKALDFLGDAVLIKDLDEWREGKKFTHGFYKESEFHKSTRKIFHRTLQKGVVPILEHASKEGRFLDLQSLFSRYMMDTTCLMASGFDLASLRVGFPYCPLLDAMDDIGEAVFWRNVLPERVWRLQRWLGVGKEKRMKEACIVLNKALDGFVCRKQESDEDFNVLKFYMAGDANPSKKFLVANIMTFLFAGRDTSAALLTWFFYLISRNPKAENAITKEISSHFPPQPYLFSTNEDLSKLVYLHSALLESLRLYPTVPVIIRDTTRDDVLPSGHKVAKSTKVILCSYAMGRTMEIWGEDCGEFRPERWMCGKHVASHSFLAFGSGPWACPGREVAFARMKGVVATILHNFRVEVLEGQRGSPSVSALLAMNHGLKAKVFSRWTH